MNIKAICLGAFALSVLSGVSFAGALDEPSNMQPFFTDAGMKTMKSEADVKAAWAAMSADDRAAITKECADEAVAKSHADFCKMAMQMK